MSPAHMLLLLLLLVLPLVQLWGNVLTGGPQWVCKMLKGELEQEQRTHLKKCITDVYMDNLHLSLL